MIGSRFSLDEVRIILSQDHLRNTAQFLGRHPNDVEAENLIEHFLRHHIPMQVNCFTVEEKDQQDILFV